MSKKAANRLSFKPESVTPPCDDGDVKRCRICDEFKDLEEFHRATGMRDGHRNECKRCFRALQQARYAADPDRVKQRVLVWQRENRERYRETQRAYRQARPGLERDGHLRRKFGITQADYLAMLDAQGGGCALCERPPSKKRSLHVDHDHVTGEVRGLLCFTCNNGLGQFREQPGVFEAAVTYLQTGECAASSRALGAEARERARCLVAASPGHGSTGHT